MKTLVNFRVGEVKQKVSRELTSNHSSLAIRLKYDVSLHNLDFKFKKSAQS